MDPVRRALIAQAEQANRLRYTELDDMAVGMRVSVVAVARAHDPNFQEWLPTWETKE